MLKNLFNKNKKQKANKLLVSLDQCDESMIRGWVCDRNIANKKYTVELYSGDILISSQVSEKYRYDLEEAGYGNGCYAFEFICSEILEAGVAHNISVLVTDSDVKLATDISIDLRKVMQEFEIKKVDKPVFKVISEHTVKGHLGKTRNNKVTGWVEIVEYPEINPSVELFIDDELVAISEANIMRADVKLKRGGTGQCGFEFNLPDNLVVEQEYCVEVKLLGENDFKFKKVNYIHPLSPKKILTSVNSTSVNIIETKSNLKNNPNFRGHFDTNISGASLRGWACTSNEHGQAGSIVSLYVNGHKLTDVIAKNFRKDLEKHGINSGYAGFEYTMPMEYVTGKIYQLELRDSTGEFLIASTKALFSINRDYTDYDGFLKWSFFHREVVAPFREEDKRCFAYMDWLEKFKSEKYKNKYSSVTKSPLVTIVMPTYNRAHIIIRAIDSIIAQSYKNWELIIVDDGSTDNTRSLVKSLKNKRIKYRKLGGNQGVSVARNEGLKLSRGKYISYLDSDNDWRENYLLMMVGGLESSQDHECAYTGQYLYKGEEKPYAIRFGMFNRTLLENRNYIDMNAFVHNRSLFENKGGFDTNLRRLVDWDLILRYTEDKKPLAVENILSNYYFNQEQGTITISEDLHGAVDALNKSRMNNRKESDLSFDAISYVSDSNLSSAALSCADTFDKQLIQTLGVSIIIVSYNIPKILKACVESILNTTDMHNTEIILIDNASDQETVDLVKEFAEFENIKVALNSENLGFTSAVNQGIELSNPEHNIVLLNNDAIATSGWLAAMENVVINDPLVGIVAPQQVLLAETNTLNTHAPYANKYNETDVTVSIHHKNLVLKDLNDANPYFEVNFIPFFCVYITRAVIHEVGLLDEKLGRHYRSDRLYCYAVRYQANKKIIYTPKSKLYHLHQQSTAYLKKKDDKEFDVMFVKNTWEESINHSNPIWE